MKKLLLAFSLAAMLLSAKAQYHNTKIIITGVMADPAGTAGADASSSDANNKGYEYAQFRATEYINFALTPHSVVFLYETTSTPQPNSGWMASGTQGLTYKFNLTAGIVNKGDFFYVGGAGKLINGGGSLDISETATIEANRAKWIRYFDYAKAKEDGAGENDGTAAAKTTLLGNSNVANAVAVFEGITVGAATEPKDVVFYGAPNAVHYSAGPPEKGFLITDNDLYNKTNGSFFNKAGTNNATVAITSANFASAFIKFGGEYDLDAKTWVTPRSATTVAAANLTSLAAIESGTGTTVLPVSLASFTAKTNKAGKVDLAWTTASEQNNSHFEVTRSTDGASFAKIGEVAGNGNSNTIKNYSHTDNSPVAGINYYQLKQVDNDGKSALSKVVSAKVGLSQNDLTVSSSANKSAIKVSYKALATGKATFTVYSVSGAKLASLTQNVSVGANQVSIPVQLGNGLHLLQVQQGTESISVKF